MSEPETSLAAFERVAGQLAAKYPNVTLAKMFGMRCIKVGGKVFAGLSGDDMTFKLSGEWLTHALSLAGAKHFDPGMGRPMREWIQVPPSHMARWDALAEEALLYVAG